MPVAFGSPAATVALALCLPVVWLAYHSYRRLSSVRRALTTTLRVVGLVLLALALSGFRLQRPTEHLATVFLLDESASLSADARREGVHFITQAVRAAQPGDRFAVAAFGREPVVAMGWSTGAEEPHVRVATDRGATNIAGAVELGLAMLPDNRAGRIVVLSDGRETHGDAAAMAGLVRWQGAGVDVVPLTAQTGADAAVGAVEVPATVEPGARVPVRVELRASTVMPVTVRLFRNGAFWQEESLTLIKGITRRVYEDRAEDAGAVVYRVELEAVGDAVPENGRGLGLMRVATAPHVWVVDGDGTGGAMRDTLVARGIETARIEAATLPDAAAGYAAVRTVVLNNVPAAALTQSQQDALAAAVREFGVGLVMLGNTQSFGPGGWRLTPVEDVLPVTMESTRPRTGTVGIVLVLDVSGSMNQMVEGQARLRFAQDAALSAYTVAEDRTLMGLVAFSGFPVTVLPLEPRPRDVNQIVPILQRLEADGGTSASLGLRRAVELLTASDATTRHIILMTDGRFQDAELVAAMYESLRNAHVTVSTIGAGPDVDKKQLRELAEATGGIFYPYTRAGALPAVFAEDTMQALRSPIVRGPLIPVGRAAGAAIRGVHWSDAPELEAMVATTLRDTAELLASSPDQDPLVASWRTGLATTAVLCTDWGGPFTPEWQGWHERDVLLESLVRATLPPPNTTAFTADLRLEGDTAVLTADAVDATGAFINGLELEATLLGPEGEPRVVPLRQVGPGRYAARAVATGVGVFTAQIRDASDRTAGRQWVSAAAAYPAEFAPGDGGSEVLIALAEATGGRVLRETSQAFRRPPAPRTVRTDLWPWLTGVALCLFPLDVALRRFTGRVRSVPRAAAAGGGRTGAPSASVVRRTAPAPPAPASAPPIATPAPERDVRPPPPPPPPASAAGPQSTTARLLDAKRKARRPEGDDAQ